MLIVSNGAFKSGSTWLFNILRCITKFPAPSDEYLNHGWVNPSIHKEKLADFLDNVDYASKDYLVKNHFKKEYQRKMLLSHKSIYVLDIDRDLRDVVVSAYYYHSRRKGYEGNFDSYYWSWGRKVAHKVRLHHSVWRVDSPNVYVSSYEKLKYDFVSETRRIGAFLGFDLSEQDIDLIKRETTLGRLREKYSDNDPDFFRKGNVGDWQYYFDEAMLKDIEKIRKKGIGKFDKVIRALVTIHSRLKQW